jgi:hypothetical protein
VKQHRSIRDFCVEEQRLDQRRSYESLKSGLQRHCEKSWDFYVSKYSDGHSERYFFLI